MAFFKFRFPGQTPSAEGMAATANESIEIVRRRARHRLTGSVLLVLLVVVGFPLLFDTQPRPVSVDTPIVVPDRQKTPAINSNAQVPPAQAPAKPLLPDPSAVVPAQSSLDAREEVVSKPAEPAPEKAADKLADKPADPVAEKPQTPKPELKTETKPVVASKPKDDGLKAQALLDGKPAKATPVRLAIQVGAFTEAAKIREVRSKLEQAGLKTYTQVVDKDGKSTTRIRVGPFETKEDADKAAARIRKLDLPAVILKL